MERVDAARDGRVGSMSAGDLVALIVAIVSVAAFVLLVLALWSLSSVLRDLRQATRELREVAIPAAEELRRTVRQANSELDRVDGLLGTAESVAGAVDSASQLTYQAVSAPLIRVLSFGSGVGQGVRGFRLRRSRAAPPGSGDGPGRSRVARGSAGGSS
jgi:hypothetical protein